MKFQVKRNSYDASTWQTAKDYLIDSGIITAHNCEDYELRLIATTSDFEYVESDISEEAGLAKAHNEIFLSLPIDTYELVKKGK